jgi:hypothetical protein
LSQFKAGALNLFPVLVTNSIALPSRAGAFDALAEFDLGRNDGVALQYIPTELIVFVVVR